MPSIQTLRLGSGLVLWFYIATHLINHAFGLWSLAAAEQALQIALVLWHSWLGTLLLYGAFAVHLALALTGLYLRPTLRLPPTELLRIGFGLSFPLLLIGHAVTARLGYEWYGLLPQYQRVIESLLNSGSETRQLTLLAPGWLHGCMGLHGAFTKYPFYARWRWHLAFLVVALPLASAGGFLLMSSEISRLLQNPEWQSQFIQRLPAANAEVLTRLREQFLSCYGLLLLSVLFARLLRSFKQRL